jgi:arylsulfatase A-like enzyme
MRTRTSKLILLLMAFIVMFQVSCGSKKSEPNVVVIVIDTLRADHLPMYGYEKNTAPFLSELAQKGVLFENAFSASSWTAPSTASIFTSFYPIQHGVKMGLQDSNKNNIQLNAIPEEIKTIPEVLKSAGYTTYGVAENINIGKEIGFNQGFDSFKRFQYPNNKRIERFLERWADEIMSREKYFLYIHFNDPHGPYHARTPWYKKEEKIRRDIVARYDSEISYVDDRIKNLYKRFGWDKNTLLIITADHGEGFWEHGVAGHGNTLYSEVVHVPLMICFPESGQKTGRIKKKVAAMDILPTINSYLGIGDSTLREGVDLMPLVRGKKGNTNDRYLFPFAIHYLLERERTPKEDVGKRITLKSIVHKNWKYIVRFKEGAMEKDLIIEHRDLARLLFSKYAEFEKKCKKYRQVSKRVKLDKKKKKELQTLGYVQ